MDSFLLLRRLVAAIVFKGQTVSDYWWSRRTIFLTDFSLDPRKTTSNLKANSIATSNYRGMEGGGASLAQQQTDQVRLRGVTGNNPLPTAANSNSAALAFVLVNAIEEQDTLPSSRQAMAATTTSNFAYKGASIAQEHVVGALCRRHAEFRDDGAGMYVSLPSGTTVDLTWLLVCEVQGSCAL